MWAGGFHTGKSQLGEEQLGRNSWGPADSRWHLLIVLPRSCPCICSQQLRTSLTLGLHRTTAKIFPQVLGLCWAHPWSGLLALSMTFLGHVSSLRRKLCLPPEPTSGKRTCHLRPAGKITIQIFSQKDLAPQRTTKNPSQLHILSVKVWPSQGLGLKELVSYFESFQMMLWWSDLGQGSPEAKQCTFTFFNFLLVEV